MHFPDKTGCLKKVCLFLLTGLAFCGKASILPLRNSETRQDFCHDADKQSPAGNYGHPAPPLDPVLQLYPRRNITLWQLHLQVDCIYFFMISDNQ